MEGLGDAIRAFAEAPPEVRYLVFGLLVIISIVAGNVASAIWLRKSMLGKAPEPGASPDEEKAHLRNGGAKDTGFAYLGLQLVGIREDIIKQGLHTSQMIGELQATTEKQLLDARRREEARDVAIHMRLDEIDRRLGDGDKQFKVIAGLLPDPAGGD